MNSPEIVPPMTVDMKRLLKFAIVYGNGTNWLYNGEDAVESLDKLQEHGLIERHEDGNKWRLITE